jgi:glycosylphosphatidylinositol transamidase (GPIT) subunit GPI8
VNYDDDYKNTEDFYSFEVFKTKDECLKYVAEKIDYYFIDMEYDEKYPDYFVKIFNEKEGENIVKIKDDYITEEGLEILIDLIETEYINDEQIN